MLVLSCKIQESIRIGDNVTITVLAAPGKNVRIGIDAPKDVSVHREEIYERIKKETEKCNSDDLCMPLKNPCQ